MKTLKFNLTLLFLASILVSSCASDDDGVYFSEVAPQNSMYSYTALETEVLNLTNKYRSSIGLKSLEKMDIISTVACTHTDYMVSTGKVNHDNFAERNKKLVSATNAKLVAENVAYGFATAEGALNAWIKSDDHRKIIEREDLTHFGISTGKNNEGRNYFTHMFIVK